MTDTIETVQAEAAETAPTAAATDGKDFSRYLDKKPTGLHEHYTDWLIAKTGFTPVNRDEMVKIVQISVSAYQEYQKSPENVQRRADEAANKEANAAQAKLEKEAAKAKAAAEKAAKAQAAAAEKAAAGEDDEAPKKKAAPKKASAAKAASVEAPF